ncbi:MAG: hypothetical protein ACOY2B_08520 [Pseudomonadota bacterium]
MKRILILLLLLIAIPPLGLGLLFFSALQDNPAVVKRAAMANTENAERVKMLVNKYRSNALSSEGMAELPITGQDLESIIAFAVRGLPTARADAQINAEGLDARLTIALPANPAGRYLNLGFGIMPSDQGVILEYVSFGDHVFSAQYLVPALSWGLDLILGPGSGDTLTSIISKVRFADDKMFLTVAPGQDRSDKLSQRLNSLFDRIKDNEQLRIADPEIVQIYFSRLQEVAAEVRGGYVSLTQYIRPVFELAVSRSGSAGAQAVTENQAAIMALAIYFGDSRMKKMVAATGQNYFGGSRLGSHNVTVKRRHDLVQHYLTSAGLQIAAGVGVANAIGEFKEIADTLRGGSGFSFSDIAGDRAGVVLAEQASDIKIALRIQQKLSRVKNEDEFFPDINGLPDNLTQQEFERRFGDVESALYLELLADIERRIVQTPVYGGG